MDTTDPTLIYDGECGVCGTAVRWIERRSDIGLRTYAELSEAEIAQLPVDWRTCAHFIVDGQRYSCGAAMEQAVARTDHPGTGILPLLQVLPGYAWLRESAYRQFADQRALIGRLVHR